MSFIELSAIYICLFVPLNIFMKKKSTIAILKVRMLKTIFT